MLFVNLFFVCASVEMVALKLCSEAFFSIRPFEFKKKKKKLHIAFGSCVGQNGPKRKRHTGRRVTKQ